MSYIFFKKDLFFQFQIVIKIVVIFQVKLSGEGKMPVVNKCGELAIYATVDKSKKAKYRKEEENGSKEEKQLEEIGEVDDDCCNQSDETGSCNYVNIDPAAIDSQPRPGQSADTHVSLIQAVLII